jgi:hypothetical protein
MAKAIKKTNQPPLTLVGDSVKLSAEDSATVLATDKQTMELHRQWGVAREQFLLEEAQRHAAIQEGRKNYESLVRTLATKHGIDLNAKDASWTFNGTEMTFVKNPPKS